MPGPWQALWDTSIRRISAGKRQLQNVAIEARRISAEQLQIRAALELLEEETAQIGSCRHEFQNQHLSKWIEAADGLLADAKSLSDVLLEELRQLMARLDQVAVEQVLVDSSGAATSLRETQTPTSESRPPAPVLIPRTQDTLVLESMTPGSRETPEFIDLKVIDSPSVLDEFAVLLKQCRDHARAIADLSDNMTRQDLERALHLAAVDVRILCDNEDRVAERKSLYLSDAASALDRLRHCARKFKIDVPATDLDHREDWEQYKQKHLGCETPETDSPETTTDETSAARDSAPAPQTLGDIPTADDELPTVWADVVEVLEVPEEERESAWTAELHQSLDLALNTSPPVPPVVLEKLRPHCSRIKGKQFRPLRSLLRKDSNAEAAGHHQTDVPTIGESVATTPASGPYYNHYAGLRGLVVAGVRDQRRITRLKEYFGFADIEWEVHFRSEKASLSCITQRIQNRQYDVVMVNIRFSAHAVTEAIKPVCKEAGVPYLGLVSAVNPTTIVACFNRHPHLARQKPRETTLAN